MKRPESPKLVAATLSQHSAQSPRFMVAIVGRPNVGKSTLFNKLVGKPVAITHDQPGVTRDRHYADGRIDAREVTFVDTGGFDPDSDDPMQENIASHVRIALAQADLVVFVLNAKAPPLQADRHAVQLLREAHKPYIVVANKADTPERTLQAAEHYALGIDRLLAISALHGVGLRDLRQQIASYLPEQAPEPSTDDAHTLLDTDTDGAIGTEIDEDGARAHEPSRPYVPRVAIIGRPNAGKSSFFNRLIGESRQIVDDRPGTTVDSVHSELRWRGTPLVFIDTAGIRRKRSVERGVEALAVMQAIRSVDQSDVVVLLIDAREGAADQDLKIAHLAMERGKGVLVALNKMDTLDAAGRKKSEDDLRDAMNFAPWVPVFRISAKTGRGIHTLMGAIMPIYQRLHRRVTTGEVNRFFQEVIEKHPPPTVRSKNARIYYITQATVAPPTFVAMVNDPALIHPSYQRYVVNQLRSRFGFEGVPVRVFYRKRERKERAGNKQGPRGRRRS
jgi:GTP-binding protein